MDWLMDNLGTLIVLAVIVAIMVNIVGAVAPWLAGRTRTYIEKATDAHEAVYRKRKKSARLNMKGIRPRTVVMSGDAYHSPVKVGRLYGVIAADPVSDVFIRRSRWGPVRWYAVPTSLISGWLSRELYIDGCGSVARGNFYVPVWPAKEGDDAWRYDALIMQWEEAILGLEKCVEIEECRVHAISDSVQMSTKDRRIIGRNDTPPQVPGTETRRMEADPDV
jgi:hypothetical protein